MKMLEIFVQILQAAGPAFMGALYLSIFARIDSGFWQLTAAALVGGFVWWVVNSGWERYAWGRVSKLFVSKEQK
jgi:hypothetical protein